MRVLAISGSLRRGSYNTRLLRAAAGLLPPGVELVELEGMADVPPYDEDLDGESPPEAVARLRGQIAEADALLFSTPEYNASVPGVLKNAVDWASRPFPANVLRGKPALVIGASTGIFGAVWAQAELRKVLGHTGALVIDSELPLSQAQEAFEEDGGLRELAVADALRDQLAALAREAEVVPADDSVPGEVGAAA
jgi:chromate reductase, NAD(P)H dehydrogenase (quinone)